MSDTAKTAISASLSIEGEDTFKLEAMIQADDKQLNFTLSGSATLLAEILSDDGKRAQAMGALMGQVKAATQA